MDQVPDARHVPLREAVKKFQREALGCEIWDGRCSGALGRLLAAQAEARWPLDKLLQCVRNRFASDVNHAFHPATWLPTLTDYVGGPLDRYGRPFEMDARRAEAAVGVRREAPDAAGKAAREFEVDIAAFQAEMVALGGFIPDAAAWRRALTFLKVDVDAGSLDLWLRPLRILALRPDGKTIFLAPSREWSHIRERYGKVIGKALRFDGVTSGEFEIWVWEKGSDGSPWAPI